MASQKYFIPVVTVILGFALVIAIITEFGYAKLDELHTESFMQAFKMSFSRQASRVSQTPEQHSNLKPEKIIKVETM